MKDETPEKVGAIPKQVWLQPKQSKTSLVLWGSPQLWRACYGHAKHQPFCFHISEMAAKRYGHQ